MTDNDHSDDDISSLLRIGLEETQAGGPVPHWEPPSVEELQHALPQYEISGFIARGGMGAVYKGTQKALQRTVAIKVLPPGIDDGERHFAERFKREAQTMARLSHPNIVTVYEAGENADGWLYIVMEFIDGTDVGQLIASEGIVEPRRAIQITSAVCEGLAFAHEEGIIHRDIKPSNIMLDRKGRVKVADFGLAKALNVDTPSFSSATTTVGTPEFIAPEAHIAGTLVDQRADIYAVGVMLYQMLTGQIPRGKFTPPSSFVPEVDKRLDAIVDKALQTDREQRYSTASEMKTDVDATITSPDTAEVERPGKERKTSRTRVAAIAAVVLTSAAVFFLSDHMRQSRAVLPREPAANVPKPATALPAVTLTPPVPAKAGEVVTFAGHRYQFVPGNVSWTVAKAKAESMGGHLATVTSKEENTWLQKTFDAFMATEPNKNCWLGGYAEDKNKPWQWITGEPFEFQDWHFSEPNYDYGPENPAPPPYAIHFHRKERWYSPWLESAVGFNRMAGYIVEWDTAEEPAKAEAARNPQISLAPALIAATKDAPFVNSLGMKFVPVPILGGPTGPARNASRSDAGGGQRVLFSVWDTRVQDYATFAAESKRDWQKPEFEQGPTHPAVMVSWEDATAFCAWLTDRERKAGKLGANESYRLPSDHEWSCAAGVGEQEDAELLPAENELRKTKALYPWGSAWPPPPGAGNYASEEMLPLIATKKSSVSKGLIAGYHDGYANTSPVGSFASNRFGLYDMSGNVWQWCEDWHEKEKTNRVRRGGSWNSTLPNHLGPSKRHTGTASWLHNSFGFRCVLAGSAPPTAATPSSPATATKDAPFVNTLGMKFVPVPILGGPTGGQRVLFSVWDTRVQDYAVFIEETKREWPTAEFPQEPTHPAIHVSWDDAQLFCQWLTARDQAAGKLGANERYRLPSDHEWSCAVEIGVREDAAKLPSEKSEMITDAFPWGTEWPPPQGAGNYGGEESRPDPSADGKRPAELVALGYNDGFVNTSPVGSFAANRFGLHDLGGNVRQWCEDWFDQHQKERVLRGASWNGRRPNLLLSSRRSPSDPAQGGHLNGFRCVLAGSAAAGTAAPGR
jgi:serine/threonine protein kinase/formylglycine-generating enzyme required for sulfatase activity